MRKNDRIGSHLHSERLPFQAPWNQVTQLAVVRRENSRSDQPVGNAARREAAFEKADLHTLSLGPAVEHDELARAVAEIEKASEALRQWEPALQSGVPDLSPFRDSRGYRSIWLIIALIWISTSLTVVSATAAILYLLR